MAIEEKKIASGQGQEDWGEISKRADRWGPVAGAAATADEGKRSQRARPPPHVEADYAWPASADRRRRRLGLVGAMTRRGDGRVRDSRARGGRARTTFPRCITIGSQWTRTNNAMKQYTRLHTHIVFPVCT